MKVELNTQFWKNKKTKDWTKRYETLTYFTAFYGTIHIIYGIITNSYLLITINTLPTLIGILAYITYNKHQQEAKTIWKLAKHKK